MNTLADYLISFDPDDDLPAIKPVVVPPKPPTGPAMEALLRSAGFNPTLVERNRKGVYFIEFHEDAQPAATYSAQLRQALGEKIAIAREYEYVIPSSGRRAFATVDFSLS